MRWSSARSRDSGGEAGVITRQGADRDIEPPFLNQARAGLSHCRFARLYRPGNLDRVNLHWFAGSLEGEMGYARKKPFHRVLEFLRRAPEFQSRRVFCQAFGPSHNG